MLCFFQVVHDTVDVGTETAAALKAQVCVLDKKRFRLPRNFLYLRYAINFPIFVYFQTEQMSRIVNELDSIHFSIKKASQLVKEIGRQVNISNKHPSPVICLIPVIIQIHLLWFLNQVATDRCIMALLFLIVIGVIGIIIVKVRRLFALHFLIWFLIKLLFLIFLTIGNICYYRNLLFGFFLLTYRWSQEYTLYLTLILNIFS